MPKTKKMTKKPIKKLMKKSIKKLVKKPTKKLKSIKPKVAKKQIVSTIHHVVILDSSGSMQSVRDATIGGFNENAGKVRKLASEDPNQKHTVTLVTFANTNSNVCWREQVSSLKDLDRESYAPVGATALCDAMGKTIFRLADEIGKEASPQSPVSVLITVITDGEENASKEYSAATVSSLIESLKGKDHLVWTVTYMGANQDVLAAAKAYNIPVSNVASYSSDQVGTKRAFSHLSDSRDSYSRGFACRVAGGEKLTSASLNFFSKGEEAIDLTNAANPSPPVMTNINKTASSPNSVKLSKSSDSKTI